ncbi:NADP-dependent oxidoreductase domain-containing protein [Baffinella frigidus]|nr:NADP-dependent oxidoreductase domain-containing protein [Cryptophyta sp. CCMP2293]
MPHMVARLLSLCLLLRGSAAFHAASLPGFASARCSSPGALCRRQGNAVQMQASDEMITLAGGVKVSSVGVGTWAWGDTLYWQYKEEDEKDAALAFAASLDAGINLFDTAEIYGSGQSEILCGKFARSYGGKADREIQVATKFMPLPNRLFDGRAAVGEALRDSLSRLGTGQP